MKSDFRKKIDKNIQQALNRAIRYNWDSSWFYILGYSKDDFIEHMTYQADLEDYGIEWVLSKRIPLSLYSYESVRDNELKKAWSLKNLYAESKNRQNNKRKVLLKEVLDEYGLYDIIPIGAIKIE